MTENSSANSQTRRPRVFIGSSVEQLPAAKALQALLDHTCEATVWAYGVFEVGGTTVPSLEKQASDSDFAVLVVDADDVTMTRSSERQTTRDNVVFELGLFVGALGHERCFMVHDRTKTPDLPTDLLGVTPAKYRPHANGNWQSTLGAAATEIETQIENAGLRANRLSDQKQRETEMAGLLSSLNKTQEEKDEALRKLEALQGQFDALSRAKSKEERLEATLPPDEEDRFTSLVRALKDGLDDVPQFVPDGVWYQMAGQVWHMSDLTQYEQNQIAPILRDGYVACDPDDGTLAVSTEFPKVEVAVNAAIKLDEFLTLDDRSEDFYLWFQKEFSVPMDLRKKACWEEVLAR